MPDESIYFDNGKYLGVYVILYFKNKYSVYNKEDHAYIYPDTDEEDMWGVRLDDKRYRHWRICFGENIRGMDDEKTILHYNIWDVYM